MDLIVELEAFGARRDDIVVLAHESPATLAYTTLQKGTQQSSLPVVGVHEWQGEPLVYLVDERRALGHTLPQLRRLLALEGRAPYLGLISPGRLTLHSIGIDKKSGNESRLGSPVEARAPNAKLTFSRLAHGFFATPSTRPGEKVRTTLRKLLREATNTLMQDGHSQADAQGLVGRALFARFLADRRLLDEYCSQVGLQPHQLFDDRQTAATTSRWLDHTFNGDFLRLSSQVFGEERPATWSALGDIMHRAPGGQLALGWQNGWDDFDFAHIPLGVLSEAFEDFMADHDPLRQKKESAHYTPAAIAERMVSEVFASLGEDAHHAKVLDPAVGGGVFLLAVFRRLVQTCWQCEGRRPDTVRLREIMYEQLAGFDINESALRYAALGLYLLAIELDPASLPVERLRFPHSLVGRVLFPVGWRADEDAPDPEAPVTYAGSLGTRVGAEHRRRYDLVIGNPPWTDQTWAPAAWSEVEVSVASVAEEIGVPSPVPPKYKPDVPFVWRAMEWARPGGHIALAMHARLLFQESMVAARNGLFDALDVTGVINGAELRGTPVWRVSAPFMVLFAINRRPNPHGGFWLVSPHWQPALHRIGRMGIDLTGADAVRPQQLTETPTLPKVLFRGSTLDLEVLRRFKSSAQLDRDWVGANGYQKLRPSSKVRKGETEPGYPSGKMLGKPDLNSDAPWSPVASSEDIFSLPRLHFPRKFSIYCGPKLIVRKSVPAEGGRIQVSLSMDTLVFSETFYGYHRRGKETSQLDFKALFLQASSQVALWHLLMTSGEFGLEREVFEMSLFDKLPIVRLEDLPKALVTDIEPMFAAVARAPDDPAVWEKVDAWAARAYGLRADDTRVIADTLAYRLPFAANRDRAAGRPTLEERSTFVEALTARLDPLLGRLGRRLVVDQVSSPVESPWEALFLRAVPVGEETGGQSRAAIAPRLLAAADDLATTELLLPEEDGLWLVRLARARHWSRNQATICARNLAFHHLSSLVKRR